MMALQILINLFLGIIWVFFQDNWNILTFFSGYLFGILVLFILRRFFPSKLYLITLFSIIRLLLVFIKELFVSSIVVARQVTRPRLNISPGIISIDTDLESEFEVTLLSLLMNLTPGSVVVEVTTDLKRFYIHAIDVSESKHSLFRSKRRFETAIKRVTRND